MRFDFSSAVLTLLFEGQAPRTYQLSKGYHSEEAYYVDIHIAHNRLQLELHPKQPLAPLLACQLLVPIAAGAVLHARRFAASAIWVELAPQPQKLSLYERWCLKHLGLAQHPLRAPAQGYLQLHLRDERESLFITSLSESTALTSFTHQSAQLSIHKALKGFSPQHSVELYHLEVQTTSHRIPRQPRPSQHVLSCTHEVLDQQALLHRFLNSALCDLQPVREFVLDIQVDIAAHHHWQARAQALAAFAKTCHDSGVIPAISLRLGTLPATSPAAFHEAHALQTSGGNLLRVWSPELNEFVYPIDVGRDQTLQAIQQLVLWAVRLEFGSIYLSELAAVGLHSGAIGRTSGQSYQTLLETIIGVLPSNVMLHLSDLPLELAPAATQLQAGRQLRQAQWPWYASLSPEFSSPAAGPVVPELGSLPATSLDWAQLEARLFSAWQSAAGRVLR